MSKTVDGAARHAERDDDREMAMASIQRQTYINAEPSAVWDALRDFGALHHRLATGFAVDTELDGGDRIVTFFNGSRVRERLIDLDDASRRLAWSIVDGPYTHHNGVAQVAPSEGSGSMFTWTTDLLPDEIAPRTAELMERGLEAIKRTLEAPDPQRTAP